MAWPPVKPDAAGVCPFAIGSKADLSHRLGLGERELDRILAHIGRHHRRQSRVTGSGTLSANSK